MLSNLHHEQSGKVAGIGSLIGDQKDLVTRLGH